MINKAGILVNKIDFSQFGLALTRAVNKISIENADIDIIAFYQTWGRYPLAPRFTSMMEREAWGFDGTLISTNINTTMKNIKCPGPQKKLFYVWDLEWLYLQEPVFAQLAKIYCHPKIELIARSNTHYKALKDAWKEPICIMDNFDNETLKSLVK